MTAIAPYPQALSPGIEIERLFLVSTMPAALHCHPHAMIVQGYLARDPDGCRVRLRRVRDQRYLEPGYFLTAKRREGIARDEVHMPLSQHDFQVLWPLTAGRRLAKCRHYVPHHDMTIEVDIFEGLNAGLMLASVEFEDVFAAEAFQAPEWLGEEVTSNPDYWNHNLARE